MIYVLDACALIALLQNESGAEKVAAVINSALNGTVTVVMNKINLLEVYYDAFRSRGKAQADLMLTEFKKRPVIINQQITDEIFAEAGRLKATYRISLADSIALAEASLSGGELLTSDHHEFDIIEREENVKFHWIR
ncbi:MAG: PIN domain-containing protein [Oscillospiraceae bacterium]|nr:PIN domain-containing protein [Oscillospiraceae bacterium]